MGCELCPAFFRGEGASLTFNGVSLLSAREMRNYDIREKLYSDIVILSPHPLFS